MFSCEIHPGQMMDEIQSDALAEWWQEGVVPDAVWPGWRCSGLLWWQIHSVHCRCHARASAMLSEAPLSFERKTMGQNYTFTSRCHCWNDWFVLGNHFFNHCWRLSFFVVCSLLTVSRASGQHSIVFTTVSIGASCQICQGFVTNPTEAGVMRTSMAMHVK